MIFSIIPTYWWPYWCQSPINVSHSSVYTYFWDIKKQNSALWGRVTPLCVIELLHDWFRSWLAAKYVPSHYIIEKLFVVNRTTRNRICRNFNKTVMTFSHGIAFNMTSGKWRPFRISLGVLMLVRCSTTMAFIDNNTPPSYPRWSPWPHGM